jgi:hypothetical protein
MASNDSVLARAREDARQFLAGRLSAVTFKLVLLGQLTQASERDLVDIASALLTTEKEQ